jgi:hypothetical protein
VAVSSIRSRLVERKVMAPYYNTLPAWVIAVVLILIWLTGIDVLH